MRPASAAILRLQPATSRLQPAALSAAALAAVGVFSILSTVLALWALWTTDPLKSIGGFIPIISLVLTLRVWRSLGWEMDGTWWGLAIVVVTVALVHLRDRAILEFVVGPSWSIFVPPHSLVVFGYTAGVVLLFGGARLFRAALFPIVLTWFVNPVPNFFTLHVDLPLQHASSLIARGFAHGMGQKLTSDQLRLMFTPEFGMFIAPGCNGIRGAITMGFIALIAGYLYQFKAKVWAAVVVGAVMLGYVFNLVRLCFLVLFYIVALHLKFLQSHAAMGDYVIGACLFFFATALLFTLIQRLNPGGDLRPPKLVSSGAKAPRYLGASGQSVCEPTLADDEAVGEDGSPGGVGGLRSFWVRWGALALVVLVGSVSYARGLVRDFRTPVAKTDAAVLQRFPKHVGHYTLQREWNETLPTGTLIFYWADYAPDAGYAAVDDIGQPVDDGSGVVSVGISPVLGAHDTLLCHSARGEDWLWHGDLSLATVSGATNFSGSFFNDGATQYIEATTVCTGESCGQYSTNRKHFGFVYSRPDTATLLSQSPTRPIPILLRTETLNASMAADLARAELTANLQRFLAGANLAEFTKPYR
jgi:exosortase/archaeosortase family protein